MTLKEQADKFHELLDAQIEAAKGDRYSRYRLVELTKTKIEYFKKAKRNEEADALTEKNKEYPDFRKLLIDKALKRKDSQKAKELCHEGALVAKEKRFAGHFRQWEDELLRIAEKEKNTEDIRLYAVKLYFDNRYDMKYYRKLKDTCTEEEWTIRYEEIIKKIQGPGMRGGYSEVTALADIFKEEKQWPRLLKQLQLTRGSLSLLNAYAPDIIEEYPSEVLDCYEIAVKENAKDTGRSIYNETARYLKKIEKMEGRFERVEKMLSFFRKEYKNRPATMQVLEKKYPM